jgi:pyruvate-formate lyase-activating enzyme
MAPKLLFATPDGKVLEHPRLEALARSGDDVLIPSERPIPLPECGKLVHLPGHLPIGYDPESGAVEVLDEVSVGRRKVRPDAVAAVLPPGYTRTLLPAARKLGHEPLPQWAYTAAGWGDEGPVVWALHTDRRTHWEPGRFSTPELPGLVAARRAEMPGNPVIEQLSRCALEYNCFTAQNIFYRRDEGGLPSSGSCNARCLGCISERRENGPPSSMQRLRQPPPAEALAEVGWRHLESAPGRTMVSFGQGCEGEPLTRAPILVEAVRQMRARTARGSIHINTNASLTGGLEKLFSAGLDSVRVSLNSADTRLYAAYYKPQGYSFADVRRSLAAARAAGAYRALNLLILPGVTDRVGEVERLVELMVEFVVQQVQARSLCIDTEQYMEVARGVGAGGEPIGVRNMLRLFQREVPGLVIGNFSRGPDER